MQIIQPSSIPSCLGITKPSHIRIYFMKALWNFLSRKYKRFNMQLERELL